MNGSLYTWSSINSYFASYLHHHGQDITVEDLISDELGVKATKALTKLDIDAALKVASDITELYRDRQEHDMGSHLDTLKKEYELAVDTINQLD